MNLGGKSLKNKKILICLFVVIALFIIIFSIVLKNNVAKKSKIGNNSTSQEVLDYILNIRSYEVTIEVTVKSNKNENKYIIKQIYNGPEDNMQEVLEPSNIAGVKIIKNGNSLKLENSNLNLVSMFENYEYISENSLDLSSFIEEYKTDEKAMMKEKDNKVIMQTSSGNKLKKHKTLYINKETGMPERMEIQDDNKNIAVYILYNEVKVNS
jgi:outer membrane lipoprotein-sorting protein